MMVVVFDMAGGWERGADCSRKRGDGKYNLIKKFNFFHVFTAKIIEFL